MGRERGNRRRHAARDLMLESPTLRGAARCSHVVRVIEFAARPKVDGRGSGKCPEMADLIDVKFGVIVDVEASTAIRQTEVGGRRP